MWDRRLPAADAALSIRPARSQHRCVFGWRVAGGKMVNGYRAKNKGPFLEVGVKVHLLGLENLEGRLTPELQEPPSFYTAGRSGLLAIII